MVRRHHQHQGDRRQAHAPSSSAVAWSGHPPDRRSLRPNTRLQLISPPPTPVPPTRITRRPGSTNWSPMLPPRPGASPPTTPSATPGPGMRPASSEKPRCSQNPHYRYKVSTTRKWSYKPARAGVAGHDRSCLMCRDLASPRHRQPLDLRRPAAGLGEPHREGRRSCARNSPTLYQWLACGCVGSVALTVFPAVMVSRSRRPGTSRRR